MGSTSCPPGTKKEATAPRTVSFPYAYEVSCRTRVEEVTLRHAADSPRFWFPRYGTPRKERSTLGDSIQLPFQELPYHTWRALSSEFRETRPVRDSGRESGVTVESL